MTDLSLETTKQASLPALRLPVVPVGKLFRAVANACTHYSIAKTNVYGVAMGINRPPRREEVDY